VGVHEFRTVIFQRFKRENRALRIISGLREVEVTEECIHLHSEKLFDLYSSPLADNMEDEDCSAYRIDEEIYRNGGEEA
jgi:hypothetical protein